MSTTTHYSVLLVLIAIIGAALVDSLPAGRQFLARLRQKRQNGDLPARSRYEGASHRPGGACDHRGRIYRDGDRIIEGDGRLIFECRVYGDGSWSEEAVGCRTPGGGDVVHNGDRFRSGKFQELCIMGKSSPSGKSWIEVGPVGCYSEDGELKQPEESWTGSDGEPHVCSIADGNTLETGRLRTIDCGDPRFVDECFFES